MVVRFGAGQREHAPTSGSIASAPSAVFCMMMLMSCASRYAICYTQGFERGINRGLQRVGGDIHVIGIISDRAGVLHDGDGEASLDRSFGSLGEWRSGEVLVHEEDEFVTAVLV